MQINIVLVLEKLKEGYQGVAEHRDLCEEERNLKTAIQGMVNLYCHFIT
jgi:hypothetical protein